MQLVVVVSVSFIIEEKRTNWAYHRPIRRLVLCVNAFQPLDCVHPDSNGTSTVGLVGQAK